MAYENYQTKNSLVIVYTGEGKGKTTASLGLMIRALGNENKVAYIQFIKDWEVSEHKFINKIQDTFGDKLLFYKGGEGFYDAGEHSAQGVSKKQHRDAANKTYEIAYEAASNGKYDLVICDEINNAAHDGLLSQSQLKKLINDKKDMTSLCLTGRNFPKKLLSTVDIATDMTKLKHHFDKKFLANEGIDY